MVGTPGELEGLGSDSLDPAGAGAGSAVRTWSQDMQETWDSQIDPFALLGAVRDGSGAIRDLRYLAVNAAAVAYHGIPRESLIGATMLGFYPGLVASGLASRYFATVESGEPMVLDDCPYANEVLGETRWYDLRAVKFDDGIALTWRDTTDSHNAVQALADSEARYRLLAENASDVVFQSNLSAEFEWVSPSVHELLGWLPEDLVGSPASGLIHPEDRSKLAVAGAEVNAGHRAGYEARFRTAEGGYRWLTVTARPILDDQGVVVGRVGSWRDAQAEVAAREALKASEGLFRRAMDKAAIGMVLAGLDGKFTVVNQAFCELLGHDREWFLEHRLADVVDPADMASVVAERENLLAGGRDSTVSEVRLVRGDGARVWVRRVAVIMRDELGQPAMFMLQVEDVSAEREARAQLAHQAFHDSLTGLRNRAWLLDVLESDLRAAASAGGQLGVLFVDLDNFKVVNDSLGHAAGDSVLVEVGSRIAAVLGPGSRLARFGGDEFVVVLPSVADPREVEEVAIRVVTAVSEGMQVQGHRIVPTASIGIAMSTPSSSGASLLRDTDSALFRAKASGRSSFQFFDETMHESALAQLQIEGELRQAIAGNEFRVHYQPIVRLADGCVVAHEALVRWEHPRRGLLLPGAFLEVAEDSGLVVDIGTQVVHRVCSMISSMPALAGPISVNVSAVELNQRHWFERFTQVLARSQVDPSRMVIEITETAALALLDSTRLGLSALAEMGTSLHMDDFGTGFSSISLLHDLPVTGIKLDAQFVHRLTAHDSRANALSGALAGLAGSLGIVGVAEGIETQAQAATLRSLGWTHGQGDYFARPAEHPRDGHVRLPG